MRYVLCFYHAFLAFCVKSIAHVTLAKTRAFFPDNRNFVLIVIALEYHAPWKSAREARSCGVMEDEDVH
jgi:hypothetical protein